MSEPTPRSFGAVRADEAARTLGAVLRIQARTEPVARAESDWTRWTLATYAVASFLFVSLVAVAGMASYLALWLAYACIAAAFARRERVTWRGFDRLCGRSLAMSFLAQAVVCGIGVNVFPGVAAYWVTAALVVSAPLFLGAWRARNP